MNPSIAHFARAAALGLLASLLSEGSSFAQHAGMQHEAQPPCAGGGLDCASVVTPAFDPQGRLWLAWVAGGTVAIGESEDHGAHVDPASIVELGHYGSLMDRGGDARPQLLIDAGGRAVLAWSVFKDKAYNAQIWISVSDQIAAADGPAFSPPRLLDALAVSQRFPSLAWSPNGRLFLAWLDKRRVAAAKLQGGSGVGANVALAWSDDGGHHFSAPTLGEASSCECCRIAMAMDAHDEPVISFRAIFDEHVRDHALMRMSRHGEAFRDLIRVADDHWLIDGCPHHGPAIAVSGDGAVHVSWFTQGEHRQGVYYARLPAGADQFEAPQEVGRADQQAGRPTFQSLDAQLWLAWKEFDGERIVVKLRHSADNGLHWQDDRIVAETQHAADHPVLVREGGRVWLSWMTHDEGYRLIAIDTP